ncbi:hypothetical protein ACLOJK_021215 [Asimina triloba]
MASSLVFCFSTQHPSSAKICMVGRKIPSGDTDLVDGNEEQKKKKLRILVAGGGVGGLVLGLAAKNRGFGVKVFERNLSAVRGEGAHRGPIQLQTNALAVLKAIDKQVVEKIMEAECVTGDPINGLADGIAGHC